MMCALRYLIVTVLPVMVLCTGDAGIIYAAAPEERGAYHVGGKGVYNYGYNTGDGIAKVEVKHPDGSVTGSYRYFDPNGQQIVRSYIADSRGFRVLGNELPSGPDTPAVGFLDTQTLTGTVEGAKEFRGVSQFAPSSHALVIQNRQFQVFPNQQQSYPHQEIDNTISPQQQIKIKDHQKLLAELEAKQQQIVKEYHDRLEKHKQQIALVQSQLREAQNDGADSQSSQHHTPQSTSQIQARTPSGYSTSFNTGGGNYFYSDDNVNYDFPAGFAYNQPTVPVLPPFAVQGFSARNKVTVGRTANSRDTHRPLLGPTRGVPARVHNQPVVIRGVQARGHNQPFVIGYRTNSGYPFVHG